MKKIFLLFSLIISIACSAQLQRFTNTDIVVPISSVTQRGITIEREARVKSIRIELAAKQVVLDLDIFYLSNDTTLNLPGISSYQRSLAATMTNLVDATTGITLCGSNEEYVTTEQGDTVLNPVLEGKAYMYDFELFAGLMYSPVVIHDLIVSKIQYYAGIGKLD